MSTRMIIIHLDLDRQYETQPVRQDHPGFFVAGEPGYA
jgi:hypothetical protein